MDVITTTATVLYQFELPSGGHAQISASATFGELLVVFLLVMVVATLLVGMVRQWKRS